MRNQFGRQFARRASAAATTLPGNFLRRTGARLGIVSQPAVYYVVPNANWVTDWVGRCVTEQVWRQFGLQSRVTPFPQLLAGELLHYGELGAFLASCGSRRNRENKVVVTLFHGSLDDSQPQLTANVRRFLAHLDDVDLVHTACSIMARRLLEWGVAPQKVVRIPLGIDLTRFRRGDDSERKHRRRALGIPVDAFCIGSFQKDGDGWGEGMSPKYVKAPDVWLATIEQVARLHPQTMVLLTGPARGYVKQGLERLGVPYKHHLVPRFHDIAGMYHCLDAYLVASREEGGPKALLEAMATGVPLVSTRVGMAPDLISHGENGLLAAVEDASALAGHLSALIADRSLAGRLAQNGVETASGYSWAKIGEAYYRKLYQPLVSEGAASGIVGRGC